MQRAIIFAAWVTSGIILSIIVVRYVYYRFFNVIPSISYAYEWEEGPWLTWKESTRSSVCINWYTPIISKGELLLFENGSQSRKVGKMNVNLHRICLSGLRANTTYKYKIIGLSNDDKTHKFRTSSSNTQDPFNFVVVGDSQNGGGYSKKNWAYPLLINAMVEMPFEFYVHVGDATDQGNDLKSWHEFFKASNQIFSEKPVLIAVGNHDTGTNMLKDPDGKKYPDEGANFDYLFDYPYQAPVGEGEITPFRGRYYHVRYNNALLVFADTQNSKMAEPRNPQWQYLDHILGSVADDVWKIVVIHRPQIFLRKDAKRSYHLDYSRFARYFLPIFVKHGVDVVFQGHGHYYANLNWKIGIHNPPFSLGNLENNPQKPIRFITSGGAGNVLRKNDPLNASSIGIDGYMKMENSSHYLLVKVDKNEIAIEARYPDNEILEKTVIGKNGSKAEILYD